MSMKSMSTPRRLYTVAGVPVLTFKGKLFASDLGDMSAVDASALVVIEDYNLETAAVTVRQAREHSKSVTETWTLIKRLHCGVVKSDSWGSERGLQESLRCCVKSPPKRVLLDHGKETGNVQIHGQVRVLL